MKAMVLAAGLGTRLRPLTDNRPKALVEVGGRTLLELTLSRLHSVGVRDVIVNVFHFAERVVAFLEERANFGMRIAISREETLLDTGGGLRRAAWFFQGDAEPFLLHNVDVLSSFDLAGMLDEHRRTGAMATLAVQQRPTSRPLLFREDGRLLGRMEEDAAPHQGETALAFAGIQALSPRILRAETDGGAMPAEGAFSIIDVYARLAAAGERVLAWREDGAYWRDLGKPRELAAAAEDLEVRPELSPACRG